jgi:hypothetical protein
VANLESRALVESDSLFDFSENNVKECEWFEASCDGGNDWMVANFMSTAGTVLETCDPYVPSDVECNGSCTYRKTLLDLGVISGGTPAPVEVLKSYIMTYGPVYSTLYVGNGDAWRSEFSGYDGSYTLFHQEYDTPNHAVLIVGWDDTLNHAGGQGAWIVKNSWGTSWGGTCGYGSERGYFTIAYGSASIGANSSFAAEVGDFNAADTLLYHDEGGFGGSAGIMGTRTIWGMCTFTPDQVIEVRQVEFWTVDVTVDIDIYLYDDFEGGVPANLLVSLPDNSFDLAGYHSVQLPGPLRVEAGEDIFVVMKITNAVSKFPLVYDSNGPVTPGSSYMSPNGSYFSEFTAGDLGIRLRANTGPVCAGITEVPSITGISDVPADGGGYVTLNWARIIGDDSESGYIKRYRVWRKRRERPAGLLESGAYADGEIGGPYEHGTESPAWEVVGVVAATGDCCYSFNAPTTCDLTPADTCWTYFCITAHTGAVGERFDSPVSRGYSVDNGGAPTPPGEEADPSGPEIHPKVNLVLRPPEPNPSRDGFAIVFELAGSEWVEISIYDIRGRKVATVIDALIGPGAHMASWSPGSGMTRDVPPGIYFLRLATATEALTARLVLIN